MFNLTFECMMCQNPWACDWIQPLILTVSNLKWGDSLKSKKMANMKRPWRLAQMKSKCECLKSPYTHQQWYNICITICCLKFVIHKLAFFMGTFKVQYGILNEFRFFNKEILKELWSSDWRFSWMFVYIIYNCLC